MKNLTIILLLIALTVKVNAQNNLNVTPYAGALNYLSAGYENLQSREYSFQLRTGAYFDYRINNFVNLNYDAVLELSNTEKWALGIPYIEFGDTSDYGLKAVLGVSATPITKFSPHPLSIGSQAAYASQRVLPGGTEHFEVEYRFKNELSIFASIGEDGKHFGDSVRTESGIRYKGSTIGLCTSDGKVGGGINLVLFDERLTVFAHSLKEINSGYIQTLWGKEKNLLFSLDIVYDNSKPDLKLDEKWHREFIFLYFFDSPQAHLSNCAIGAGANLNSFTIYFLGQIF